MSVDDADRRGTTYNILFVCTGNTCRSPMAEAIAKHALAERGWSHVQVRSAGTHAIEGSPPSPLAIEVLRDLGLDLEGRSAKRLSAELVEWADLILAMGPRHVEAVREMAGGDKVSLLTEFLEGPEAGESIEDPFGGDRQVYQSVRDLIQASLESVLNRLSAILAP